MMTLTEFLAARLDEDEAAAKAVVGNPIFDGTGIVIMRNASTGDRSVTIPSHVATYIARHDPARVLREVGAGRKILEHWQYLKRHDAPGNPDPDHFEDYAVRPLAAVWSDHPDYDEAWKP